MKKILIGLGALVVVVLLVLVGINHTSAPTQVVDQSLGGDVRNPGDNSPNGIQLGNLPVTVNYDGGKIQPKTNTAFWKNTTGKTQYVDYVEVSTDNTASSTFAVYAYATSTAPRTLYDFVAPVNNATTLLSINQFIIATTSAATTTTNIDKAFSGKTVRVSANSYLDVSLVQTFGSACTGSICETATSSNRGFNVQWRIRYHD